MAEQQQQLIEEMVHTLTKIRTGMVVLAKELLGRQSVKYTSEHEGMSPEEGFDCSGFVKYIAERAMIGCGVSVVIPRHANEQWRGMGEWVDYSSRAPGDFVYFASRVKGDDRLRVIGHVGMVVSPDTYIHAPGVDGTHVSEAQLPERQTPLTGLSERDIYRFNPVGLKRLTLPIANGRWHVW